LSWAIASFTVSTGSIDISRPQNWRHSLEKTSILRIPTSTNGGWLTALLRGVRGQFAGIQTVLRDLASFSLQVPVAPNSTDFARAPIGGFHRDITQEKIEFLPRFKSCGNNCRAAMIIHECGHYVASAVHFAREGPTLSGTPDCPDESVKNPDGSCRKHPRNYRDLTPQEAALNACTYAAFAFHAFSGQDLRPGAFKINF
jgi:hypothetical protein